MKNAESTLPYLSLTIFAKNVQNISLTLLGQTLTLIFAIRRAKTTIFMRDDSSGDYTSAAECVFCRHIISAVAVRGLDLLSGKRQQDPTSLRLVEWIIAEGCRNYGYGPASRAGVSTSCVAIDGRDSTSLYVEITVITFNYLHQNRLLRSLQDLWCPVSSELCPLWD